MDDGRGPGGCREGDDHRRYRSKDVLVSDAVAMLASEIAIPDTGSTRDDPLA
jgi:hypothetical protein